MKEVEGTEEEPTGEGAAVEIVVQGEAGREGGAGAGGGGEAEGRAVAVRAEDEDDV